MGVMHFDFMSDKLGYQTNVYVILPNGMEKGERPDGILYLLHGEGGNGLDWMRNTAIERYVSQYRLAVIMPEVDGSSFYADMEHGYPYFEYLTKELPVAMEAMLPLLYGVKKRYVAGVSMGGYGAFKWAFSAPEYFCAAANLSGFFSLSNMLKNGEFLGTVQYTKEEIDRIISCNWGSLEMLEGSISDSVTWLDKKHPELFAGIGTNAPCYHYAQHYLSLCNEKGRNMKYEEIEGGHDWEVWDVLIRRFLDVCVYKKD